MYKVLAEITSLSSKDCFNIVERHKSMFTYPLHMHREYELNFIQNGAGTRRIVGDSVEEIGEYELVLITGENLEHVWEQGNCKSTDIREITIQFAPDLLNDSLLDKNQFSSIKRMIEQARNGIQFPLEAIMKTYSILDNLAAEEDRFIQFLKFLELLYLLSGYQAKQLASSSFAHATRDAESRRVMAVKQYINDHYAEQVKLEDMAALAGMSPSSFSRFFKVRTGKTLSEYLIDTRLGYAARALVDSTQNISEICYACGFNNISNFNRIFRSKRGMSPRDFRTMYRKTKVLV